jgi:hypothetical protein
MGIDKFEELEAAAVRVCCVNSRKVQKSNTNRDVKFKLKRLDHCP